MDIKSALNAIIPPVRGPEKVDRTIKMGSTTDRDANGQQQYSDEKPSRPMTEEEFQKALEHLQGLEPVKLHNLSVEPVEVNGKRFVLLKEPDGKVLRRISEPELWTLQVMQDPKHTKGQLLSRSA